MICRAARIVRFSTCGLSIQDLALAWKEKRVIMSWDSKYQTVAECERLDRIIDVGKATGNWTWTALNNAARTSFNIAKYGRNATRTQLKKTSKTRTGLKSTSTSAPVPAGFQSQFQVRLAGPSGAQVMNDQPASAPQDLAVPEQVIFSLPWQGSSVHIGTEPGHGAERRMGEGLNLIQPAVVNCRQPRARGKKGKAKRAKKVPASEAQQAVGPLQTASASVAPPVFAAPGYDISSLMAPTSSHATTNSGPVSSQNADDPIPSFDLFNDDLFGLESLDADGASAAAPPGQDAEIQAMLKILLEGNPVGSESPGVGGVDSVQDTGVPSSATPVFGDALALGWATQTVALADLYTEAAPTTRSELSPILTPGEILAAAFAPKFDEGRGDFFF